jgi:hypothetical protein
MPWGCRAVAEDPDGRAVEVNQRGTAPLVISPGLVTEGIYPLADRLASPSRTR